METIVLLLLVATGTVGAVGSGNDEGRNEVTESSLLTPSTGSSDMATTTEPLHLGNCVVPLYSDRTSIKVTSPVVAAIAESAENRVRLSIEGRCFLACAASDTVNQDKVEINNDLTEYWPYVTVKTCGISWKVHECTRGCIIAMDTNYELSETACSEACVDDCRSECGGMDGCVNPHTHDPWMTMTCLVKCLIKINKSTNSCRVGCREANALAELAGNVPLDPSGPPGLTPHSNTERVAQFTVDLSGAIPRDRMFEPANQTTVVLPVTFLFRFEEITSHNVSYIWTVSPFTQLDLANYACQDVNVSFAVANAAGLSNFSSPTPITVPGDYRMIPNPPTNIRASEEIDKRIGFFGHVILNVSWERHQDDAYLDSFTIIVSPATGVRISCGNRSWRETVPSDNTSVIVLAESPSSLPVMECTYNITVFSTGPDGSSKSIEESHLIQAFDPGCITFNCEKLWQPDLYLFWFKLTWTVPPYISHGDIINVFNVYSRIRDTNKNTIVNEPSVQTALVRVTPQPNCTTTFTLTSTDTKRVSYHYPHSDSSWVYYIETVVDWNENSENLPYVPLPPTFHCNKSVISPSPSTVDNFTVLSHNVSDLLITLDLLWTPPSTPNGILDAYNVCIGAKPLKPAEEVPHMGHFCGSLSASPQDRRTGVITIFYLQRICLYVQIRAHNKYVPGNWSEPFRISSHSSGLCSDPVPSQIENLTVTSFCIQDDDLVIDLSWLPPTAGFNEIADYYNVCISDLETAKFSEDFLQEFCKPVRPELSNAVVFLPFNKSLLASDESYVFIRMRANNIYGTSSSWSDAFTIPLNSAGLCQIPLTHKANSQGGVIAGSLFACLLLAGVFASCVCFVTMYLRMAKRRRRLLRITQEPCDDPMFCSGPRTLVLHRPVGSPPISPQTDEWELPANEVIIEDCLGEGAFGEVYKGIVKCPIINPKVRSSVKNAFCTPVAIKLLKLSAKGGERKDFLSEIEMMKKVAEGQNPHVVCLVGCVTIQEPLCLITEFVKYGDLLSYLKTNRRMYTGSRMDDDSSDTAYTELGNVSPADLMSFAYQIASGMEYLSSLGIVHRDLACRNILVDEGKVLKITDFGMSRETDEIYVQKRTGRVPLKWMAIESIIAREFTSASDVWSYGVTLWEIGTLGGFPYPSIQNEDLLSLLKRGYRMDKPDNCSPDVYDIMLMCWNEEPQKRPKFTELRAKFDAMLLAEKNEAYIDLHIDSDQPYYRLDTMATTAVNGLRLSPNPSRHSFIHQDFSEKGHQNLSKELSPKRLPTPSFSPSHQSDASCCSSAQASPRKPGLMELTPSLNIANPQPALCAESCADSCEPAQTPTASELERRDRDHTHEVQRRPVSALLPNDRERRERQNPYVDEPSRLAVAALVPPIGIGRLTDHRGSDAAIELNHLSHEENTETSIQITITEN